MSPQISMRSLHLPRRQTLQRANALFLETLVLGGLLLTAIGAVIYDIGRLLGLI